MCCVVCVCDSVCVCVCVCVCVGVEGTGLSSGGFLFTTMCRLKRSVWEDSLG